MCRWLGYLGSPIEPRELLYDPERSLIEQSRRHAPDMAVPNGDGFGLGWYGRREVPAVFHSATPAWGDRNLHTLASEISSPLFLAHVRAATGTPVQETNCHPFAWGRWLFVHNGYIDGYEVLRRDLLLAVRPDLFPNIKGTTDSELMFHLALTFGLEDDPIGGLERMAGLRGVPRCRGGDRGAAADDRRRHRRRAPLGGPLRQRTRGEHALPQRGRRLAAPALPRERAVRPLRPPTRGWSSPSRSPRCPGSGTRSRRGRRSWWARAWTSRSRSGHGRPPDATAAVAN